MSDTNQLVKLSTAGGMITTAAAFEQRLQQWHAEGMHVLVPMVNFGGLAPGYGLLATACKISPDFSKHGPQEVYQNKQFCSPNEVAISKIGWRKIQSCAGITVDTIDLTDDSIQGLWKVKAIASRRGMNGEMMSVSFTHKWDMRQGSEKLKGMPAGQVGQARVHGLRHCEARAISGAIRELVGGKQKYTQKELEKPFISVQVSLAPDMSNPEVARIAAMVAFGATANLYPGVEQGALPASPIVEVEGDRPNPDHPDVVELDELLVDDVPAVKDGLTPVSVIFVGRTADAPADAPVYVIKTGDDKRYTTEDKGTATTAHQAMVNKTAVTISADQAGTIIELLDVVEVNQ